MKGKITEELLLKVLKNFFLTLTLATEHHSKACRFELAEGLTATLMITVKM